eukprot:c11112_g1_i2.p1 GENE.c11112_g1_i2~~c11112_g1_i2.p1  ORF type:complete len:176 (-),score=44.38 c11112_g1_i2:197-724(-)
MQRSANTNPSYPQDRPMATASAIPVAAYPGATNIPLSGPAFQPSKDAFSSYAPEPVPAFAPVTNGGQMYPGMMASSSAPVASSSDPFTVLLATLRNESSEFRRFDVFKTQKESLGRLTYAQAIELMDLFTMSTTRDDMLRGLKQFMNPDDLKAVVKAKVSSEFQQQILLDSFGLK